MTDNNLYNKKSVGGVLVALLLVFIAILLCLPLKKSIPPKVNEGQKNLKLEQRIPRSRNDQDTPASPGIRNKIQKLISNGAGLAEIDQLLLLAKGKIPEDQFREYLIEIAGHAALSPTEKAELFNKYIPGDDVELYATYSRGAVSFSAPSDSKEFIDHLNDSSMKDGLYSYYFRTTFNTLEKFNNLIESPKSDDHLGLGNDFSAISNNIVNIAKGLIRKESIKKQDVISSIRGSSLSEEYKNSILEKIEKVNEPEND